MSDYYQLLGVPRDASQKDIRKAWAKKMHGVHPDKPDNSNVHDETSKINEAYEVLNSEDSRKRYDEDLLFWDKKDADAKSQKYKQEEQKKKNAKQAEQAKRRQEAEEVLRNAKRAEQARRNAEQAEQDKQRREAWKNSATHSAEQAAEQARKEGYGQAGGTPRNNNLEVAVAFIMIMVGWFLIVPNIKNTTQKTSNTQTIVHDETPVASERHSPANNVTQATDETWQKDQDKFFAANPQFMSNAGLHDKLNTAVIALAKSREGANMSGAKILERAANIVLENRRREIAKKKAVHTSKAQAMAKKLNIDLPKMINKNIRENRVTWKSNEIHYSFTFIRSKSREIDGRQYLLAAQPALLNNYCSLIKPVSGQGISAKYNFFGSKGRLIVSTHFSPKDCTVKKSHRRVYLAPKSKSIQPKIAAVDVKGFYGRTKLMVAVSAINTKKVKEYLNAGANTDLKDRDGNTALIFAVSFRNNAAIDLLLAARAKVNLVNKKGASALMYAVEQGNLQVAEKLILYGADYNAKDMLGNSVLQHANVDGGGIIVELNKFIIRRSGTWR